METTLSITKYYSLIGLCLILYLWSSQTNDWTLNFMSILITCKMVIDRIVDYDNVCMFLPECQRDSR